LSFEKRWVREVEIIIPAPGFLSMKIIDIEEHCYTDKDVSVQIYRYRRSLIDTEDHCYYSTDVLFYKGFMNILRLGK